MKDDHGERKVMTGFSVSRASRSRDMEPKQFGGYGKGGTEDLRIFHAEILLRELASELNQGPVAPAFWIFKEGYGDVAVAEVEERSRSGSREHS